MIGKVAPVRVCGTGAPTDAESCGRRYCGEIAWRNGPRRDAETYTGGKGLCVACYGRYKRRKAREAAGAAPKPRKKPDPIIPADELLDEYAMIRDSCGSIRQAAERMGVTFARLDQALYRARKRGDDRARPPLPQALRAIEQGTPFDRANPRRAA